MSGIATTVGVIVTVSTLLTAAVVVGEAGVLSQRAAAGADGAALAAADTLSGVLSGDPCERAAQVARANGTEVLSCTTSGASATITAAASMGALQAQAVARAGPPPP